MKHTVKRVLSFILLMLMICSSTLSVFAHGGAGGASQPISPSGSSGDFPLVQGYGFRVYLYDTASEGYLWEGSAGSYKSLSGIPDILDKNASNTSFYLNVGSEYKTYDEQYGSTPWISVDTMSEATFNTMPGMSGYVNPSNSHSSVDFAAYATVFNQIDTKAATTEGMQEIIDWFSNQGVNTSGYSAETTLVVVEPVVKWKYRGGFFVLTYQNIRKYDATRNGCFNFFNFTPSLTSNCQVSGDRLIPQSDAGSATSFINGYLGAFYQAWVYMSGDCLTQSYDSSSGYAYYGCAKLPDNDDDDEIEIEEIPVDSNLALQDYQLNYVFPNVIDSVGDYTTIVKNVWTYDSSTGTSVSCNVCGSTVGKKDYSKSYNITITDTSSGTTVTRDNILSGTKLLLYNTASGTFDTRNVLLSGKSIDTSSETTYVVDYGFNLVRSLFGDNRVVSSISPQTISESYASDVLGLTYGNTPSGVVNVSSYRNSYATFGSILDNIAFGAKFNATDGLGAYTSSSSSTHTCHNDNGTTDITTDDAWGNKEYHSLSWQDDVLSAFTVGGEASASFSLDVTSVAYKYSTKNNQIGKSGVNGLLDLVTATSNGTSRKLNKTYSFGVVSQSSINLKFYPEVEMMAYEYSGDTINGTDSITAKKVMTMGEKLRTVQSSSLYLFTVKSHEVAYADMQGCTYSDTAVTGDEMLGSELPVMAAGGDFTMVADSNFSINLYGYSLDVINKTYDSLGLKLDNSTIPYTDVIADSSNVYTAWGNHNSTSLLSTAYNTWVSQMMNIDNYACDLSLVVTGGNYYRKSYDNFSATFGDFSTWSNSQDGAFPLVIKNGDVDSTSEGYKALIRQIADDYDCTEVEAKQLFKDSGLYTAILNAIESSSASYNNSQSGVSALGSSDHWYDEQVRTLVVRRFVTSPIYVQGVTCSDKVDYGAAQSYISTDQFVTAKWYFTFYFTDNFTTLGDFTVYCPDQTNDMKQEAVNSGNIIVDNLYISKADFNIGKTATSSFGW